jgi:O-antigen ligase
MGQISDITKRISLRSFIGNPNFVSNYLASIIPLSCYFVLKKNSGIILRIYSCINIFVMYWVVLITNTRSINAAFLAGIFFMFLSFIISKKSEEIMKTIKSKKFTDWLFLIFLIIVFLFIIFNFNTPLNKYGYADTFDRIASLTKGGAWNNRILGWESTIAIFNEEDIPIHKFLGSGISTYQIYASKYLGELQHKRPEMYFAHWSNYKRAHNDYLQVLGEMGLIGFIGVLGILISIFIYYIKVLKNTDDFNKLLLYCMYGWSAFIMAAHAFTEFPLQIQPNIFICVFIFSTALSEQFIPIKTLEIKKSFFILIPLLILSLISTYFKVNQTLSERYFLQGEINRRASDSYYEIVINQLNPNLIWLNDQLSILNKKNEANILGSFEFNQNLNAINEIENEKERIETLITQYTFEAQKYYDKSIDYFLKSLDKNKNFGLSKIMLGQLLSKQPFRFNNLTYEDLPDVFNNSRNEYRHLNNDFKGNLNLMPFNDSYLRSTVEEIYINTDNEEIKDILLNIQSFYDQINYLESAFISFSEKNSYRQISKLNFIIYQEYNILKILMPDKIEIINKKMERTYQEFHHWYNKALDILPASWNSYPEWEDVYSEYLFLTIKTIETKNEKEVYNRVIPIIQKDGFANHHMTKYSYGIPKNSLILLTSFYNILKDEKLKENLVKEVLISYKDVYNIYKKEKEESTQIYTEYLNSINEFLELYELFLEFGDVICHFERKSFLLLRRNLRVCGFMF